MFFPDYKFDFICSQRNLINLEAKQLVTVNDIVTTLNISDV